MRPTRVLFRSALFLATSVAACSSDGGPRGDLEFAEKACIAYFACGLDDGSQVLYTCTYAVGSGDADPRFVEQLRCIGEAPDDCEHARACVGYDVTESAMSCETHCEGNDLVECTGTHVVRGRCDADDSDSECGPYNGDFFGCVSPSCPAIDGACMGDGTARCIADGRVVFDPCIEGADCTTVEDGVECVGTGDACEGDVCLDDATLVRCQEGRLAGLVDCGAVGQRCDDSDGRGGCRYGTDCSQIKARCEGDELVVCGSDWRTERRYDCVELGFAGCRADTDGYPVGATCEPADGFTRVRRWRPVTP